MATTDEIFSQLKYNVFVISRACTLPFRPTVYATLQQIAPKCDVLRIYLRLVIRLRCSHL